MIHRVHEMASPLRLVTNDGARAGCVYEEMAAGWPANFGFCLGLGDPALVDGMLPAAGRSGIDWDHGE
jgi:hypothetical protein